METNAQNQAANTKTQLIMAGIEELNRHGMRGFSTRRVAKQCGISCAAPYKHFENTSVFIAEILSYMNALYHERQTKTLQKYANCDLRKKIYEISLDYIRFLVEHPEFRGTLMQGFEDCNDEYRCLRGQLSVRTYELVSAYCTEVQMPEDVRKRKTFVIRSIIYGAAFFFSNGEMAYSEENLKMAGDLIDREFDLP